MANFSLLAKLGLDSKSFQNGLKTAQKKAQGFSKHIGKLFAFTAALGGLTALIRKSVEFGSAQSDVAGQLKISTEAFQVFTGAMKDAGGSQKNMEKSILGMQSAIVQGSEGLTTFIRAFDRIGLNIQDLRAMNVEDQFLTIARAITDTTDAQGALTAAGEIFGKKNAPFLIEVLERLGDDGFATLRDEIEKTYGLMDEETQVTLDDVADRLEQFQNKFTITFGKFFVDLLSFGDILRRIQEIIVTPFRELGTNVIVALTEVNKFSKTIFAVFLKSALDFKSGAIKLFTSLGSAILKALKGDFGGAVEDLKSGTEGITDAFKLLQKEASQSTQTLVDSIAQSWKEGKDKIDDEIDGIKKSYDDLTGASLDAKIRLKKKLDEMGVNGDGDGDGDGDGTGGTGGTGEKEDKFKTARSVAREAFKASGNDLANLATVVARGQGKKDTRFEAIQGVGGEERFQRFDGGKLTGNFTKEEIAVGLGKSAQKEVLGEGAIEDILVQINENLKGKFVSE
jgi:hypothetical protein